MSDQDDALTTDQVAQAVRIATKTSTDAVTDVVEDASDTVNRVAHRTKNAIQDLMNTEDNKRH
jgi:hypothetical protein